MENIEQRYLIKADPQKVWKALTDPQIIEKWGAGPAVMSSKEGDKFSLWGGDIYGKNIEVQNPKKGEKKLVQEWYGGEWVKPSIVTIILNSDDHITEVILKHEDVPEDEKDEFSEGWKDYYFGQIKKLLEKKSK